MLDFTKLRAPAEHGKVLIAPRPEALPDLIRANHRALQRAERPILDRSLSFFRSQTRNALIGEDRRLFVVTGHAPEFIHPGVWAKQVVATRLAAALRGFAVNLVVDSDAPRSTKLPIPICEKGQAVLRSVPIPKLAAGYAFEQLGAQTPDEIASFEESARAALGGRYESSQMPGFFTGLRSAGGGCDWVDQLVTARRAVELDFGVETHDRRISAVWFGPLLLDMLKNAEQFAACYNDALADYRRRFGVRGSQHPIPDLYRGEDRCEVPAWVYRLQQQRRRLFLCRAGRELRILAGDTAIGSFPLSECSSSAGQESLRAMLGDWRVRPRALALTLWARLLVADLFIHGIGGAKYDRITDRIMESYYGIPPPPIACVSATLHLGIPHTPMTDESVRRLRHLVRDLRYNPQRHVPPEVDFQHLIQRRESLVRRAVLLREHHPRDRTARNGVFRQIRDANSELLSMQPEMLRNRELAVRQAADARHAAQVAEGREYFFGLYDAATLLQLLDALPDERTFRV